MKGIYILMISIGVNVHVSIGALGSMKIEKGLYAYVGSAQRNLEKRVARYISRGGKRKLWHIDFLLSNKHVEVSSILCREAERSEECKVAKELGRSNIPLRSFGSSGCGCTSHMFRLVDHSFLDEFALEPDCFTIKGRHARSNENQT